MNPTNHFRWFPAAKEYEPFAVLPAKYAESDDRYFILQQWWTDGKTGEWRNIPVAWDYENTPPQ